MGFRGEACFRVRKRFIVDYVTSTCPEPKSEGATLAPLGKIVLQPQQNGHYAKFVMSLKLPSFALMAHMVAISEIMPSSYFTCLNLEKI